MRTRQRHAAPGLAVASVLVLALSAAPAAGQVAWDSPLLLAPGAPPGFGIHVLEPHPGDGPAAMGQWRSSAAPVSYGLRVGVGQDATDDVGVFAGIDVSGPLVAMTADNPVGFMWVAGVGVGVGGDLFLSIPLGVAAGSEILTETVLIRPYGSPRVVLDAAFGDGDDFDADLAVDLGVDLAFDPRWTIRVAGTLGDRRAFSVGVDFTTGTGG